MSEIENEKDWKLKLSYGKLTTPFQHYTLIGEGIAGALAPEFSCPQGPAFMSMKAWALSSDQSIDMLRVIGSRIGFTVTGNTQVWETEPEDPPGEKPYGYDINFTPYTSDEE